MDLTHSQRQAIQNIKQCLEAEGSNLDKVVRRRIYINDTEQFRQVDSIWSLYFEEPYPVSTCVQIVGLAKEGALVEFEVDAEARNNKVVVDQINHPEIP